MTVFRSSQKDNFIVLLFRETFVVFKICNLDNELSKKILYLLGRTKNKENDDYFVIFKSFFYEPWIKFWHFLQWNVNAIELAVVENVSKY